MKVILLAPTPPPAGGIAGWTMRMLKASLKNGWQVEVVDEKVIGNREVFGDKAKKSIITEIRRSLRIWSDLWKKIKSKEAKVVHSCIPAGTLGMMREYVCALITKINKRKFIIHYRCTIPNMVKSKFGLFIFKKLTNISDLAITLNVESEKFLNNYCETECITIPNFIEESDVLKNEENIIRDSVKKVLYVGGVIETKGCKEIIQVAKEFPNIEFRLVGKAEDKIKNMNMTTNVVLCGEQSSQSVKREFEEADVFMFVSYFSGEGFSNALLEAMSNKLPCIVSDWAANKDMIEEKGGFVVDVKDVPEMISSLSLLINDKNLREEQANWNFNKVKKEYTETVVTAMYVDAYEKVIKL